MNNTKLTILGIVAVFMVIWAVVQSRVANSRKAEPAGPVYLIQGLDTSDVDRIELGTGEDAVSLQRRAGRFVVANKDNYPAETSEINDLLKKCMEIQTARLFTDDPANHEDLEVTEEKARSVIKFFRADPNSPLLTGIAVGKAQELGEGTYVRLLPGDQVYVAPTVPWFGSRAIDFTEQELVAVERDDIESVTVNSPSGKYTLRTKDDSQDIVLENLPAGKQLKSSDSQSVFTALASLRFDDVKKKTGELTFDRQFICKLKDSTVYTLTIAQKDDKTYAMCVAEFTDTTPVEMIPVSQGGQVESEEELKKKEAKLLARDKAKQFTGTHQGWVYEIAEWKANNLTKQLSDLLEDEEKPEDPNAAKAEESVTSEPEQPEAAEKPAVTDAVDPNAVEKVQQPNEIKADDPNAAKIE